MVATTEATCRSMSAGLATVPAMTTDMDTATPIIAITATATVTDGAIMTVTTAMIDIIGRIAVTRGTTTDTGDTMAITDPLVSLTVIGRKEDRLGTRPN